MADNGGGEPLFRANKRRKVFRKRNDADEDNIAGSPAAAAAPTQSPEQRDEAGETASAATIQRARRAVVRKHGVAFTSSGGPQQQDVKASEESALVPIHPSREQNVTQPERFVKPTGKAVVEDDKHMTAFIDSKLAEMRSANSTSTMQPSSNNSLEQGVEEKDDQVSMEGPSMGNAASSAATDRNTKQHGRASRPKRSARARDASDLARDSLIDDIMKESTVPLYDRSTSGAPLFASGGEAENDEAAAEAFKQQFLVQMEEQNRQRRPNPAPFSKVAAAKGADRTSHGPKLGGSRAQRERLKAAQAAEAAQGGAKK